MAQPAEGPGAPMDAEAFANRIDDGDNTPPEPTLPLGPDVSPPEPAPRRDEPTVVITEGDLSAYRAVAPGQFPQPSTAPTAPTEETTKQIAELRQRVSEQDKGIQKALEKFAETEKERDALKEQLAERDKLFTPPPARGQPQWPGQPYPPAADEGSVVPQELFENPEELARHLADVATVQAQTIGTLQQQFVQLQNAFVSEYNDRAYHNQYEGIKRIYGPMLKQMGVEFPDYGTVQRIADSQNYWNTVSNPIQEAMNMYVEVKTQGLEVGPPPTQPPPAAPQESSPPPAGLQAAPVSGRPSRPPAPRLQPGASAPATEGQFVFQKPDGRSDHEEALRQARQRAGVQS